MNSKELGRNARSKPPHPLPLICKSFFLYVGNHIMLIQTHLIHNQVRLLVFYLRKKLFG